MNVLVLRVLQDSASFSVYHPDHISATFESDVPGYRDFIRREMQVSSTRTVRRLRRHRSRMQDRYRLTAQAVRMFWTVRGANSIIALRCNRLSNKFEDYWDNRSIAA